MPDGYPRGLLARAWNGTKAVWRSYRSWLAPSGPIGALSVGVVRKGWLLSVPSPLRPLARLVNDYGNTRRYATDNQKLSAIAATEDHVVFMGDSITDFWGRGDYAVTAPFFTGSPYVNRGITGQVTAQMLLRFYADVIALKPKGVVILAGINDIFGNIGPVAQQSILDNFMAMIDMARTHNIRIVLGSVLPVSDYYHRQVGPLLIKRILALNEWLEEFAAKNDCVYLDYFSGTVDEKGYLKSELSDDGLHPNAAGYAVMAPLAEKAIAQALARL